jgi:hypothetical protein
MVPPAGFERATPALGESLRALPVVALKGVLSWRFNAICCHLKPRRVADSPTKHRPQKGVGHLLRERPAGGVRLGRGDETGCALHRLSTRRRGAADLDRCVAGAIDAGLGLSSRCGLHPKNIAVLYEGPNAA